MRTTRIISAQKSQPSNKLRDNLPTFRLPAVEPYTLRIGEKGLMLHYTYLYKDWKLMPYLENAFASMLHIAVQ